MIQAARKISARGSWGRRVVNTVLAMMCLYLGYLGFSDFRQGDQITQTGDRITQVENSPCTRANAISPDPIDVRVCDDIVRTRELRQSVPDACVQIRKTFLPTAVQRFTRCRVRETQKPSTNEPPGPGPVGPGSTKLRPDSPGGVFVPDVSPDLKNPRPSPSPPTVPDPPGTPPVVPPIDPPDTPAPDTPSSPALSLPDVNVGIGNGGVCADVGGLSVGLGSC